MRLQALRDYALATRAPFHSLLTVAPLVLLHALLTWLFQPLVRSSAAAWLQAPLVHLGLQPWEAAATLSALLALLALVLSRRELRRGELEPRLGLVPASWLEGSLWGLALHWAVNLRVGRPPPESDGLGPGDSLCLALGAGIYEELLFRVLLYGLVLSGIRLLLPSPRGAERPSWLQVGLAVIVTSLAFALAHHLGEEPITWHAVSFRFLAALYLTTLYALRGLGIAVTAHAAYDVLVGWS
ncbi:MAG: CPBP family intramembrane glutamic endopeptidase [Acidobacteriota bacterium]